MARILIVDDSPTQLVAIRRIVERLGHETLTAEDGIAGIGIAKAEQPDLILMDVVMPNLNGFQATRTLKRDSSTRHIPIVLVTTKDQDIDRMWGMRQGAKFYITKPFSEAELTEIVKLVLEETPVPHPPKPTSPPEQRPRSGPLDAEAIAKNPFLANLNIPPRVPPEPTTSVRQGDSVERSVPSNREPAPPRDDIEPEPAPPSQAAQIQKSDFTTAGASFQTEVERSPEIAHPRASVAATPPDPGMPSSKASNQALTDIHQTPQSDKPLSSTVAVKKNAIDNPFLVERAPVSEVGSPPVAPPPIHSRAETTTDSSILPDLPIQSDATVPQAVATPATQLNSPVTNFSSTQDRDQDNDTQASSHPLRIAINRISERSQAGHLETTTSPVEMPQVVSNAQDVPSIAEASFRMQSDESAKNVDAYPTVDPTREFSDSTPPAQSIQEDVSPGFDDAAHDATESISETETPSIIRRSGTLAQDMSLPTTDSIVPSPLVTDSDEALSIDDDMHGIAVRENSDSALLPTENTAPTKADTASLSPLEAPSTETSPSAAAFYSKDEEESTVIAATPVLSPAESVVAEKEGALPENITTDDAVDAVAQIETELSAHAMDRVEETTTETASSSDATESTSQEIVAERADQFAVTSNESIVAVEFEETESIAATENAEALDAAHFIENGTVVIEPLAISETMVPIEDPEAEVSEWQAFDSTDSDGDAETEIITEPVLSSMETAASESLDTEQRIRIDKELETAFTREETLRQESASDVEISSEVVPEDNGQETETTAADTASPSATDNKLTVPPPLPPANVPSDVPATGEVKTKVKEKDIKPRKIRIRSVRDLLMTKPPAPLSPVASLRDDGIEPPHSWIRASEAGERTHKDNIFLRDPTDYWPPHLYLASRIAAYADDDEDEMAATHGENPQDEWKHTKANPPLKPASDAASLALEEPAEENDINTIANYEAPFKKPAKSGGIFSRLPWRRNSNNSDDKKR